MTPSVTGSETVCISSTLRYGESTVRSEGVHMLESGSGRNGKEGKAAGQRGCAGWTFRAPP